MAQPVDDTPEVAPALSGTVPPPTPEDEIQAQTSSQDYVILRFAVVGLTLIALVSIVGSLILIYRGEGKTTVAEVAAVIGLGGVAVGGLVTMLTRVPLYPIVKQPSSGDRRRA